MSRPDEVDGAVAPSAVPDPWRLLHWVSTTNPFYVVSAGLFLAGLRLSFAAEDGEVETWALMIGLATYTTVLAVTGWLLVRHLHVWDDARTVLLLVVLMFLATSVTFDEALVFTPLRGGACFLLGLSFAMAVSEVVMRSIRLRLPMSFRLPYHLALSLFFLYPLGLRFVLTSPPGEAVMWALWGFSPAAGLIALSLIPAARQGPDSVSENGSPWQWPLYPWSLFVFLAAAVPARSFLLCHSFHLLQFSDFEGLLFGGHFVAPFGFGIAVLLLEIGLTPTRRTGAIVAAMAVPPILAVLAAVGNRPDAVYQEFLDVFAMRVGVSPLYFIVVGAIAFYTYAALRGVRFASECLTAALLALSVLSESAQSFRDVEPVALWQFIAAAMLQLALGLLQRTGWRCLLGSAGLVAIVTMATPPDYYGVPLRPLVAYHLMLFCVMLVGAVFADALGRWLQLGVAFAIFTTSFACIAAWLQPRTGIADWVLGAYPLVMSLVLAGYGWALRQRSLVAIAAIIPILWLLAGGWRVYLELRRSIVGLDYIVWSVLAFAAAFGVSYWKSGSRDRRLASSPVPESPLSG